MKYHVGRNGPAKCTASKRPCPLGGEEVHFTSLEEAATAYEASMKDQMLPPGRKTELTDELVANGKDIYPKEVLVKLGQMLKDKPYTPLTVLPAGSALYNTVIPGKPVHDFDFTVVAEPYPSLRTMKQSMQGELDVNFVSVTDLSRFSNRSTPLSEALFARRAGHNLTSLPDSPYSPMLASFRLSEMKYFDLLDDVMKSPRQQFEEPVTPDTPNEFRNFKHTVRWRIYQLRWGKAGKPFDPRLTEEERGLFLESLKRGTTELLQ